MVSLFSHDECNTRVSSSNSFSTVWYNVSKVLLKISFCQVLLVFQIIVTLFLYTISSYIWDWGDGTTVDVTTDINITHTYTLAGNYTVLLSASTLHSEENITVCNYKTWLAVSWTKKLVVVDLRLLLEKLFSLFECRLELNRWVTNFFKSTCNILFVKWLLVAEIPIQTYFYIPKPTFIN